MTEGNRDRGGELLAQAKAQQQANRDSLLRSQQEQKDLGAIGRLGALYNSVLGRDTAGARNVATGDPPRRRPEPSVPVIRAQGNIGHGLDLNASAFISLPCWLIGDSELSPVNWSAQNAVNNVTGTLASFASSKTFRAYSLNNVAFAEDVVTFPSVGSVDNTITVTTVNEPGGLSLISRVTMSVAEAVGVRDIVSHTVLALPTGTGNCILTIKGSIERTIYRAYALKSHVDIDYRFDGPDYDSITYWQNEYAAGRPGNYTSRGYVNVFDAVTPPSTTSSTTTSTDFAFAYLCGKSAVKRLAIPDAYASVLADFDVTLTQSNKSLGFYKYGSVNAQAWTPQIFKTLNDASEFIDPAQTKDFPEDSAPILTDKRKGFYSYLSYLPTPEDVQFLYYAKWTGDPTSVDPLETDFYADIPKETKTVTFPPSDLEPETNQTKTLHAAWDWADPAYCRRMCLALGFTAADLKP